MKLVSFMIAGLLLASCTKNTINANPVTPGDSLYNLSISTDKAVYSPGETAILKVNTAPPDCMVRYLHLGEVLKDEPLTTSTWNWQLPAGDYTGYLVEIYKKTGSEEKPLMYLLMVCIFPGMDSFQHTVL
jgi:dextranase